jgi:hypothetical protein
VQGFSAQQPEHNAIAVHNHTPVPTGRLDTLHNLTSTIIRVTHGDVAPDDLSHGGRTGTLPLAWQAMSQPIRLASNVIKDLGEAQAFEPPRGPGTEVSL